MCAWQTVGQQSHMPPFIMEESGGEWAPMEYLGFFPMLLSALTYLDMSYSLFHALVYHLPAIIVQETHFANTAHFHRTF